MKPPFTLDAHPRRPRPLLSEPPAGYFDQLPTRVMARLPHANASEASLAWRWLSPALRTGLASVAVLGGFAASFYLSEPQPAGLTLAVTSSLDAVPHTELVGYLLTSGANVENADLAVLAAANPGMANGFLHASDDELTEALDGQPSENLPYL